MILSENRIRLFLFLFSSNTNHPQTLQAVVTLHTNCIVDSDNFCEILARNYAPGAAAPGAFTPGAWIIRSNILSPTCSRSMFWNLLYTQCAFKYVPPWSIVNLEYYSRLKFMLQEHICYIDIVYTFNYVPGAWSKVWSNILSQVCPWRRMHNVYITSMLLEHVGIFLQVIPVPGAYAPGATGPGAAAPGS